MALRVFVLMWNDFLNLLSKKEQGVTGVHHGGSMDR